MDYNKLCDEIIKLDEKIRYAGVYNTTNGKVYDKMAKERERLLSQEQTQNSLIHAYMRWKLRQQYAEFVGEPIYAMAKYTKINRITIPSGIKMAAGMYFITFHTILLLFINIQSSQDIFCY